MGRYTNNLRFAMLTDEQLIDLVKLHLSNDRYDGRIEEVIITHRRNDKNENEPFWVGYEVKTTQYGREEGGLSFKRLSIDEWDHVHRCLEELNVVPVSAFIRKKNDYITDLECSNRGWLSANTSLKESLRSLLNKVEGNA